MGELFDLEIELAKKIVMLKDGSLIEARECMLNATELLINKKRTRRVTLIIRKRGNR
ncbi:hypothetical protein B0P06_002207 [Clostridium saccharoperbutylacetonicum]|uniref:Uncharacterized protein n=1 Tax=Clostridium saccharoperbutylacetonicum N1-4(HMT) TaxID=931276 RepID=M1MNI5_9CLOT|nr:hypothetical protein [Clostridium saccharoperbutylacetonicum]AGF59454.1 hypothetical protein Cspa_c57290 [Clostridium saccharoperbutylacetonicum N1-4(HMT)]NRT59753.1 hypothetical protein [Clostridium saccharoperbutylacetonicum]NSB23065.1 hypothetical protein [Clostridium saccharoperbutylacetonicum]NSB42436.1 hypothetical protein [Clostridium saccharoperbutylacetonicum]